MKLNEITYEEIKKHLMIECYDWYDYPLFFVSKSPEGKLFLNYMIEDIDIKTTRWLFAEMTYEEFTAFNEGKTSTLTLLNSLYERKRLYYLLIDDNTLEINRVQACNFDKEAFPTDDFYI